MHRSEILKAQEKKKEHSNAFSVKGKNADFLFMDENVEWWPVFIITDEHWKCWGPWASQGQDCVWCNFILFPFLILSKLYWFPSNLRNRKWPLTFLEVPRGWIPSRQLCVELRQITTIFLFLFFLPWKMVIAVTWDEGKDAFSTQFHKSEFKELHCSSLKTKGSYSLFRSTLPGKMIRFSLMEWEFTVSWFFFFPS